jgi:HEAT repeat protein
MLRNTCIKTILLIVAILGCSCIKEKDNDLKQAARVLIGGLSSPDNIRHASDGSVDLENGFSVSTAVADEIKNNWNTPERINTIASLSSDRDAYIRQMAIISLGIIGQKPEVMTALIRQLGNPDAFMSEAAYMAFIFMKGPTGLEPGDEINQTLLNEWSDDNLLLNMNIAYVVSRGVEDASKLNPLKPDIAKAFESEDPNIRYCAARVVWRNDLLLNEYMPDIVTLLRDDDSKVKRIALMALNKAGNFEENIVELVLPLLQDEDSDVRLEAATYIGLAAYDLNISAEDQSQALNVLFDLLRIDDVYYELEAVKRIGVFGQNASNAVPLLIDTFGKPGMEKIVRYSVIMTIGNIGPRASSAVPFLTGALHNQDSYIQYYAIESLGLIGPEAKDTVPDLMGFLHSQDSSVACAAMGALSGIGPYAEAAIPELTGFLNGSDKMIAIYAAGALARIDPDSEEAILRLNELQDDPDSYIADAARMVLGQLSQ